MRVVFFVLYEFRVVFVLYKRVVCIFCVLFVFAGLRTGQYDLIMRWWSPNLCQVFLQS